MRQETLGARDDGLLALSHDAQRVSKRGGVVILQAYHATGDYAQVAGASENVVSVRMASSPPGMKSCSTRRLL